MTQLRNAAYQRFMQCAWWRPDHAAAKFSRKRLWDQGSDRPRRRCRAPLALGLRQDRARQSRSWYADRSGPASGKSSAERRKADASGRARSRLCGLTMRA